MRIYCFIHILCLYLINSSNNFLFSVIISIYNTEKYLEDSINSVLQQSIGFNKIQMILIDDGSTDNSGKICQSYQNKYPDNIKYIRINHMGVSIARNTGLKYAKGEYINFLDSDDKWDKNAFKYVYILIKLYKNLDIISCRIKYFETSNGYHLLDYKFKNSRIINLDKEYDCIQLHVSSSFVRYSSIKQTVFDKNLFYGEDAKFIANIIIKKRIFYVVRESIYYYRKRIDSSSAMQNSGENIKFYFDIIENLHISLINKSIELFNKILPFIQFYIAYEFLFRLESQAFKFLNITKYKKYCLIIQNILKKIEDKYIFEQRLFSNQFKIFALSIKYSRDIRDEFILKNSCIIYSKEIIININKYRNIIILKKIKVKENKLYLIGIDRFLLSESKYFYFCIIGNKKFYPKYYYFPNYNIETLYGIYLKGRLIIYEILLDINDNGMINFYISINNDNIRIFPSLEYLDHLPPLHNSYYSSEQYIIKNYYNNLYIYKNKKQEKLFEQNYCIELKKIKKDYLIKIREKLINKKNSNQYKGKKQIWLINDNKYKARDNGEYFFRYLRRLNPNNIQYYFIISKNCSDFNRLETLGNVIDYNSSTYLNYFLNADKIITSIMDSWSNNPFGDNGRYFLDLYNFDYIYLKNDIIKDDISRFLNKINYNFDLIIASSNKEYKYFLNNNFGYNKNIIDLTGSPKYDNLKIIQKNLRKEKIILIYPTWRMYIKGTRDLINNKCIKSENFKNTTYFKFYNDLINNKKLLDYMKDNNYFGILCLHPNFEEQYSHFKNNEIFKVIKICNTEKILVKSSLLITDYSSIFFDFAYLEKPIIYTHFDYNEYRNKQFSKGYFDYKRDGFGKICFTLQCIIEEIKFEIQNKMIMRKIYKMRTRKFFKFFDEQNCYRTFISIQNHNKYSELKENKRFVSIDMIFNLIFIYIFVMKIRNSNFL